MHKKTSAALAPWLRHHYLSKPRGGGGWGVSHTRTGPSRPPPPVRGWIQSLRDTNTVLSDCITPTLAVTGASGLSIAWGTKGGLMEPPAPPEGLN